MMWLKAVKAPNAEGPGGAHWRRPAKLQASIASANAAAQGAGEDAFGKSADMRHALQGPLLALDISMGNPLFPLATLSLGGLRVDEDSGQVLDATGQAILACTRRAAQPSGWHRGATSAACRWRTACSRGGVPGVRLPRAPASE